MMTLLRSFNGKPLTYGIDYTYTEEYNSEYRRVELVFSTSDTPARKAGIQDSRRQVD